MQIQQWRPRIYKSSSGYFVFVCTKMAALMKTAYDGYRYILYECGGKKLHLDTGRDT
jgi:hypothetical protein